MPRGLNPSIVTFNVGQYLITFV
uniref:Uncharacterized protein n=1 Tax=Rhizophora mucronata TaxID=61149 RepID=A0A2P2L857_RHIMU